MGLKLVYLVASRLLAWIRLSVRDSTAKDVEILMPRHQLAFAQRRDPRLARKLTWPDRAWLVLLAELRPATTSTDRTDHSTRAHDYTPRPNRSPAAPTSST